MSVSSVQGASQVAALELQDDTETEAQEEVSTAAQTTAAAAVSAPMVLETSSLELLAELEPLAAAMGASATTYPATSSGYWNEPTIITFSSLDMAATIMGLTAAEKTQLAALGTLTFRHEKSDTYTNTWTPVLAQRITTDGSIYNFSDQSKNIIVYAEAGAAFVKTADYGRDGDSPSLTKDQILALSSEDLKALVRQYGMPDLDYGVVEGVGLHGPGVTATNLLFFRIPRNAHELTIILSEKGEPIVVENLDKKAVAKLTATEQKLLSALPAFTGSSIGSDAWGTKETYKEGSTGLAATLGLSTTVPASIQALITVIDNAPTPQTNLTGFNNDDKKVFMDQLEVIKRKLAGQVLFDAKAINDEVEAIKKRYEMLYAFSQVNAENSYYENAVSLDGGTIIVQGRKNFMDQERKLLQLALARESLLKQLANRKVDLPTLIVQLQLLYTLDKEALIAIKSEEVRQHNELLKTYAQIQKLVTTSAGYKDGKATVGHLGTLNGVSDENRRAISMFDTNSSRQLHPLERLRLTGGRPTMNLIGGDGVTLNLNDQQTWSSYNTTLGETVTLLNQESQIMMNDLSALEKEKTRFYEMCSNAVSKWGEVTTGTARNV